MLAYRIYKTHIGHVMGPADTIEADTDAAAIEQAMVFVDGLDVELWEGARLVATLPGSDRNLN